MPTTNQVILFLTNKTSAPILKQFDQITREIKHMIPSVLLFNAAHIHNIPLQVAKRPHHIFTNDILHSLGYVTILPNALQGSEHFALLDFYRQNPNFDHYWFVEDDVRFNGNWHNFFSAFSDLYNPFDFISCHLTRFDDLPHWFWWNYFHSPEHITVPHTQRIRSFNPIYRISNNALSYLNNLLTAGWRGHQEILLPTLLSVGGFSLGDLGGNGKYVINGFENKFYKNENKHIGPHPEKSSMRYRPVMFRIGNEKNILYHPVKTKAEYTL
jgi:hypothetical protein